MDETYTHKPEDLRTVSYVTQLCTTIADCVNFEQSLRIGRIFRNVSIEKLELSFRKDWSRFKRCS